MANLTEKMGNIWKKIKNQPKDIWFFYLFLLTFTLGVRKVLLFFPIKRAFNEYAGVYVYASDIFLWLAILVWIISILYNKIINVSSSRNAISEVIHRKEISEKDELTVNHKLSTGKISLFKAIFSVLSRLGLSWKWQNVPRLSAGALAQEGGTFWRVRFWKMFHVEQSQACVEQFRKNDYKNCSTLARRNLGIGGWNNFKLAWNARGVFLIPLLLVIWSFATVAWSENQMISFYKSARFLELYLLFIYVSIRFVPYFSQYLHKCSTWNNLVIDNNENVPRGTFLNKMFHVEQFGCVLSKTTQYFCAILLGLVVIMLFDHYLWDIWQGQVLFWLVCGALLGVSFGDNNKSANCSTLLRQCSGGQAWNNLEKNENADVPRLPAEASAKVGGIISIVYIFFAFIMLLGVVHSLIGIAQFITQHSIGLFWLKESLIRPDIAGVAKIIVNYQPFIRAYGLFPHPNILGGFLFFSIIVTMLYKKMFHVEHFQTDVEHFNEQNNTNCSTWNNLDANGHSSKNVPRGTFWSSLKEQVLNRSNIISLILLIQIFGILVSFSKSAILALAVAWIYTIVPRGTICTKLKTASHDNFDDAKYKNCFHENCSTPKNSKLFHVEQFRIKGQAWNNFSGKIFKMFHMEHFRVSMNKFALFAGFSFIAFISLAYFKFDFQAFFMKSLEERGLYLSISQRIISESPIIGVGTGQFIFDAVRLFPDLASWQYQPVHNVFLLIWSEWGIVGLVLFIVFLWKLFHSEKS